MHFPAKIAGTGSEFPKRRLTNKEVVERLARDNIETSDEWIRKRTGIQNRHISDPLDEGEQLSSLAFRASMKALEMAHKTPKDIDQILFATTTPDTLTPSSASWLHKKLGCTPQTWGMDLNAACSGFMFALHTAECFIKSGTVKTSLVIGADKLSTLTNWKDRNTCVLFGDGAGAIVVEAAEPDSSHRIYSSNLATDGELADIIQAVAGGSNIEITPEILENNLHKIQFRGKELFKIAANRIASICQTTLDENKFCINDIDWFIPHQANKRIIQATARKLELPDEKILYNLAEYGNTSSATIPTVLDEAVRDGTVKKGDVILLASVGGGLTYGATLLRW